MVVLVEASDMVKFLLLQEIKLMFKFILLLITSCQLIYIHLDMKFVHDAPTDFISN